MTWILQNVKSTYRHTILLSHSMGGLLAADAYIDLQTHPEIHHLVNITALISFDAPFFGIRTTSLAKTGMMKAKGIFENNVEIYNSFAHRQESRQDDGFNTKTNKSGKWIAGLAFASASAAIMYTSGFSHLLTDCASSTFIYHFNGQNNIKRIGYKHCRKC